MKTRWVVWSIVAFGILGSGENPPSSQAITAQVISRCGR
jgi:hypothetical protein